MESLKPENDMTFTPLLDPEEESDFTQALLEDTSALLEIFINVNARQASAYLKEDLHMILGWIEDSIGLDAMNSVLKKGLCDWLRKAGSEAVDKRVSGLQTRMKEEEVLGAATVEGVQDSGESAAPCPPAGGLIITQLQEEEKRLLRRKELLTEDLDRFDHVEPLEQTPVLDKKSLEAAAAPPLLASTPVLLGTTGHHSHDMPGGICGGVLPAFLQFLVSQPVFRRDVHIGTDSQGQSRTSESRFHSELRNVCALWEKAQDGIISLDMLIDKFPPMSQQLSLEPSDFSEFVNTVIEENQSLQDFWPLISMERVMTYVDAEGTTHKKAMEEMNQYWQVSVQENIPLLADLLKHSTIPDEIDGYNWFENNITTKNVTVASGVYWKKQSSGCGRVAVMLGRISLDYSTFQSCFNPAACIIPSELSMKGLEYQEPHDKIDEGGLSDELVYRPKGIITYHRLHIENEDDTRMTSGVYESYVEVDGLWWFCSEFTKTVRLIPWESVQKETSKSAYMVLFDSSSPVDVATTTCTTNDNSGTSQ
jgi:hypothetical protein